MKIYGNPEYYRFLASYVLDKKLFGLPYTITILKFTNDDLADPKSEPVCLYTYAGISRYLWSGRTWSEVLCDWPRVQRKARELLLDTSDQKEIETYKQIIDLSLVHNTFPDPSICENLDNSAKRIFVRSVYQIKD